jgi:hypothetical protein
MRRSGVRTGTRALRPDDPDGAVTDAARNTAHRAALTFDGCGGPGGSQADLALILALRDSGGAGDPLPQPPVDRGQSRARGGAGRGALLRTRQSRHRPPSALGDGPIRVRHPRHPLGGGHRRGPDQPRGARRSRRPSTPLFRSGTAHYDEVAVQIVEALGETVVGFDVNGDAGATFDAGTVESSVLAAGSGSIGIAHLNQPSSGTARGVEAALDRMLDSGVVFGFPDGATTPPA